MWRHLLKRTPSPPHPTLCLHFRGFVAFLTVAQNTFKNSKQSSEAPSKRLFFCFFKMIFFPHYQILANVFNLQPRAESSLRHSGWIQTCTRRHGGGVRETCRRQEDESTQTHSTCFQSGVSVGQTGRSLTVWVNWFSFPRREHKEKTELHFLKICRWDKLITDILGSLINFPSCLIKWVAEK